MLRFLDLDKGTFLLAKVDLYYKIIDLLFANSGPLFEIVDLLFDRAVHLNLPNPPDYGPDIMAMEVMKKIYFYFTLLVM